VEARPRLARRLAARALLVSRPAAAAVVPEARGLRHLAFEVADVAQWKARLEARGVAVEPIRVDEYTGRRFTFFADPDELPLELYEAAPR
jgi:catechol 2,3-dioxygenase-like lactoylglutathione lyase family enzyme